MTDAPQNRIQPCPLCGSDRPVEIRRDSTQYVTVLGQSDYHRDDRPGDFDDSAKCYDCAQVRPDLYVNSYGIVSVKEPTLTKDQSEIVAVLETMR